MVKKGTPDEFEQRYVEKMGPELGALCYRFWTECVYLHMEWKEFTELSRAAGKCTGRAVEKWTTSEVW